MVDEGITRMGESAKDERGGDKKGLQATTRKKKKVSVSPGQRWRESLYTLIDSRSVNAASKMALESCR